MMVKEFYYLYVYDGEGYPEMQYFKNIESARTQSRKELKWFKGKAKNQNRMIEMYIGKSRFENNHMIDDLENPIDTIIK